MPRAETRERLRRLIRELETRPRAPSPGALSEVARSRQEAPLAGAVRRATASGECTYRERRYELAEVVGTQPLVDLRWATGAVLGRLAPDAGVERAALDELLFLDIETTGLGGAGVIAFLVATGRVEDGDFVLRQYLAHSPAEEGALLDALLADADLDAGDPVLVTYNGRAFDAPVLDGRATLHRRRAGFESLRHVDLLLPARTVYRGWLASCRLATIEAEVLGLTRPAADVDGAEVPAWYFRYLRSGDLRCIEPIASHNLIDVLSLAALTGRLAGLVAGARLPEGGEALGLGRLFAGLGEHGRARGLLAEAAVTLPAGPARSEALMRLGLLHRRAGRHELAEPLWWELAAGGGAWSLHAHEELAKFYEHRTRDLPRALEVVERALAIVGRELAVYGSPQAPRWEGPLRHRLARLTSRADRMRGRT